MVRDLEAGPMPRDCPRAPGAVRVLERDGEEEGAGVGLLSLGAEIRLIGGCTSFGDRLVLIARATADADGADNLSVPLQRDASGENHDLAVVGSVDAKELSARLP